MDFEVSEKMEIILTMVGDFMRDEVIPLEGEMLHGSSEELARLVAAAQVKVRQMGLWAPNHPVEYGGLGLSMVDHAPVERGARTQPARTPRVRDPGPGFRQRRDPARPRHR